MIRPAPLQAQYLPGVRWADTAPVMVQTLMVRSLAETGTFGSVGRGPVGTVPDFTALSELTDFQAETTEDARTATVRVRVVMRLVRESDAKVVATRTFSIATTAGSTDTKSIVVAFDESVSRLLPAMVSWLASNSVKP
jgi:cholesterol transport system auxiliary component